MCLSALRLLLCRRLGRPLCGLGMTRWHTRAAPRRSARAARYPYKSDCSPLACAQTNNAEAIAFYKKFGFEARKSFFTIPFTTGPPSTAGESSSADRHPNVPPTRELMSRPPPN